MIPRYYLYKFGQFLTDRLSLKASYGIAVFFSNLHYYLSWRDRRSVKNNLKYIVADGENISRLAKGVFLNFGKYLADFFRMIRVLDRDYIARTVTILNREYIDEVLQNGKGGILLTAHMAHWEMGAVVLSVLGYPLVVLALPHREKRVNDLFNFQREAKGMTVIQTNTAVRRCVEALKDNKLVALAADRDFTLNGEPLDFFGKKTLIPKGPAAFSLKTGAPIIPAFIVRNDDDTFTLSIERPIVPPTTVPDEKKRDALLDIMKQYTSIIEGKVRANPSQWLVFREFWIR